jgi:hypothetical protein
MEKVDDGVFSARVGNDDLDGDMDDGSIDLGEVYNCRR